MAALCQRAPAEAGPEGKRSLVMIMLIQANCAVAWLTSSVAASACKGQVSKCWHLSFRLSCRNAQEYRAGAKQCQMLQNRKAFACSGLQSGKYARGTVQPLYRCSRVSTTAAKVKADRHHALSQGTNVLHPLVKGCTCRDQCCQSSSIWYSLPAFSGTASAAG